MVSTAVGAEALLPSSAMCGYILLHMYHNVPEPSGRALVLTPAAMHLLLHLLLSTAALMHPIARGALPTRRSGVLALNMPLVEPPPPAGFVWATEEDAAPALAWAPKASKPPARDAMSLAKQAVSPRLQAMRDDGARTAEWLRARAESKPVMRQAAPVPVPEPAPLQRAVTRVLQALGLSS